MKACRHCQNMFEDSELEAHQHNCARNPDVQEKARRAGEIEKFVKTVVLKKGRIKRLFWAHSTGAQDFSDEETKACFATWDEKFPATDHHSPQFLKARGFKVVFDG